MGKRNYTHVQALLPEIKAMLAEGKPRGKLQNTTAFVISRWLKGCLSVSEENNGSRNPSITHREAEERCFAKRHCASGHAEV